MSARVCDRSGEGDYPVKDDYDPAFTIAIDSSYRVGLMPNPRVHHASVSHPDLRQFVPLSVGSRNATAANKSFASATRRIDELFSVILAVPDGESASLVRMISAQTDNSFLAFFFTCSSLHTICSRSVAIFSLSFLAHSIDLLPRTSCPF